MAGYGVWGKGERKEERGGKKEERFYSAIP
jgi:hypothetical protein